MSLGLEGGVSSTERREESLLVLLLLDFLSSLSSSFIAKLLDSVFFFCADFVLFRRLLFNLMHVSGLASMNPGARVQ